MAKILVYTTPAQGHLYPIMDTALTLARRGHHVHVRTMAAEVGLVAATALRASAVTPAVEARVLDDWQRRSPVASLTRSLQAFIDRAPLEVADIRSAIAADRPDLVVVDTNAWGAQAAAESSGIPWATWHTYPLPFPSKDAPPFGPGLRVARGPLGWLRDRLLAPLVIRPLQKFLPQLNRVRAAGSCSVVKEEVQQSRRGSQLQPRVGQDAFMRPRPSNMACQESFHPRIVMFASVDQRNHSAKCSQ